MDMAEYMRRRNILSPLTQPSDSPTTIATDPSLAQTNPTQVSGLQELQQYMAAEPKIADYHPSKLRRVGAAIAGGLAGMTDPRLGTETGRGVLMAPYAKEQQQYQQGLKSRSDILGLQQATQEQQAKIGELGARTEAERNRGEYYKHETTKPYPWAPQTQEEAMTLEGVKHPVRPVALPRPVVGHPGDVVFDPTGQNKLSEVPNRPTRNVLADQTQLEELRNKHRQEQIRLSASLRPERRPPAEKGVSAASQRTAEQLAAEHLATTNPEYKDFYDIKTKTVKPASSGMFSTMFGGKDPKEKFKQFLLDRDALAKQILSKQAPGKEGDYEVEEVDPDEPNNEIQ